MRNSIPDHCSFTCPNATSPGEAMDGSRTCMTFAAVACGALKGKIVHKGAPCPVKNRKNRKGNAQTR